MQHREIIQYRFQKAFVRGGKGLSNQIVLVLEKIVEIGDIHTGNFTDFSRSQILKSVFGYDLYSRFYQFFFSLGGFIYLRQL